MRRIHVDGEDYKSLLSFCKVANLNYSRVSSRLRAGYTFDEAIKNGRGKKYVDPKKYGVKNKHPCEDHLGNKYDSREEMCKEYNVSPSNFCHRLARGWTLAEALTIKGTKGKRHESLSGEII